MRKPKLAQSVLEYFIIMTVILAAVLASGFLGRVKGVFGSYFNKAANTINSGN